MQPKQYLSKQASKQCSVVLVCTDVYIELTLLMIIIIIIMIQ